MELEFNDMEGFYEGCIPGHRMTENECKELRRLIFLYSTRELGLEHEIAFRFATQVVDKFRMDCRTFESSRRIIKRLLFAIQPTCTMFVEDDVV